MLVAFWMAFTALAAGLALWIAVPASDAGALCLTAGLLGLLLMPMLRLAWALATAIRQRDWLMFMATLAVLAILGALTLRDAASFALRVAARASQRQSRFLRLADSSDEDAAEFALRTRLRRAVSDSLCS